MLGHSSIVTTADTHTSALPETAHRAAQATADMLMTAARNVPGARRGGTDRDPHPCRRHRVRLLPDVTSRSSRAFIGQGVQDYRAGTRQKPQCPRVTQECPIHAP